MFKKFLVSFFISVLFLVPNAAFAQEYFPLTEDSTFLTFPEWYIVFSAQEYAQFLKDGARPSEFNYLDSVKTYWVTYYQVTKETLDRGYSFNFGNHLMLGVIGVSYTGEYLVKALYESTLGSLSEKSANYQPTYEDQYGQEVAYDYGQFLTHTPWYEFPYQEKLKGLWTKTPALSEYPQRSMERKFALSLEYEIKALYGWAMRYATNSVFSPANPKVEVVTSEIPQEILDRENIEVISASGSAEFKINLPRYNEFSEISPRLLSEGVEFYTIAGHDEILLTALGSKDFSGDLKTHVLFETPVYSDVNKKRVALVAKVSELHDLVKRLSENGFIIEHLFDY